MFVSLVGSFVPGTPGWEGRRWREPGQWGVSASHAAREASLPAPRPPHHVVVVLSFHSECVISSSYSAVLLLAAGGVVFKENYRKKTIFSYICHFLGDPTGSPFLLTVRSRFLPAGISARATSFISSCNA